MHRKSIKFSPGGFKQLMVFRKSKKRISPKAYNKAYLLSNSVEGYEEFKRGGLSYIKAKLFNMLALEKDIAFLEVGIGRGEFLYHCAKAGAKVTGIDYSKDVVEIAKETLREFSEANILLADGTNMPFDSNSFERVFAGDVIEHLCYEDAVLMLKEMYRVLKPGGFMLIHTAPNTIFTKLIYPLAKHILKLINKDAAKAVDRQLEVGRQFHIHEYNLFSLRKVAKKAGLTGTKIWIDKDILRSGKHRLTQALSKNPLITFISSCGRYSIIRFLLGNDLYLKSYKPEMPATNYERDGFDFAGETS